MYTSYFEMFQERRLVLKSAKIVCSEPPRVPSSRYHTLNVDKSYLTKDTGKKVTFPDQKSAWKCIGNASVEFTIQNLE